MYEPHKDTNQCITVPYPDPKAPASYMKNHAAIVKGIARAKMRSGVLRLNGTSQAVKLDYGQTCVYQQALTQRDLLFKRHYLVHP